MGFENFDILLVSADEAFGRSFAPLLDELVPLRYRLHVVASLEAAWVHLRAERANLLLVEAAEFSSDLVRRLRVIDCPAPVVVLVAASDLAARRGYLADGAADCWVKSTLDSDRLESALRLLTAPRLAVENGTLSAKRRMALLAEISRRLLVSESADEILQSIFADLARELNVEVFFNFMVAPSGDVLLLESAGGISDEDRKAFAQLSFGEMPCGTVAATQAPLVIEDVPNCPLAVAEFLKSKNAMAYAGFPLIAHGRLVGTLAFASMRLRFFDEEQLRLIETVADLVAVAVERMRLADEVRAGSERVEIAINHAQVRLWDWDLLTDTARMFASGIDQDYGLEEVFVAARQAWAQQMHPDDRETALELFGRMLANDSSIYHNEFRLRKPDGSYWWALSRGTIFRDEKGVAYRILGSNVDVTELKNTQAQLQQARDGLERRVQERTAELLANETRLLQGNRIFAELTTLHLLPDTNLQQAIERITVAAGEMLDVQRCSVWMFAENETKLRCFVMHQRGSAVGALDAPMELSAADYPAYFDLIKRERLVVTDDVALHPALAGFGPGYLEPLGVTALNDALIVSGGQNIGVLCCERLGKARPWRAEDSTFAASLAAICALVFEADQRSEAEAALRQAKEIAEAARAEAERANAAKSEFLSRMSHELRTPLNSILGFAQLMEMDAVLEQDVERVSYVMKAGQHLLQLINEVLDFTHVESGRLSLASEPVSLSQALGESLEALGPLRLERGVRVFCDMEYMARFFVQADLHKLSQILLNLLSNAIKYNRPQGEVHISCAELSATRLQIAVRDTGIGIAAQDMAQLFQPFERLGAQNSFTEGTGLGLALSQRLAGVMDGVLYAESTEGQGSVFYLELPRATAPSGISLATRGAESQDGSGPMHTVLYIEDNLANFQLIEHVLAGYPSVRLLSAMQGQLGLDLAAQHQPSLILLDLNLPDIQGDEVLRRLLANPALCHVPVVIISADASPQQMRRLLLAGASDYLAKPIDVRRFLGVVQEMLKPQTPPK